MASTSRILALFAVSAVTVACGARTGDDELLGLGPSPGAGGFIAVGGSGGAITGGSGGITGGFGGTGGGVTGGSGASVGDCCWPHGAPGCSVPWVESCVCAADSYCCSNSWDDVCVEGAERCQLDCGGGTGGVGGSTGGFGGTGGFPITGGFGGIGGTPTGGAGGSTGGVPITGGFGGIGGTPTGGVGGSTGGTGGTGGSGPCCGVHAAGCDEPAVESCVCGRDPYCCNVQWDYLCVEEASECRSQLFICSNPGSQIACTCQACPDEIANCGCGDCQAAVLCGMNNGCF
ncbi:MAG TPA: hypothetical protein VLC09_13470 [Polyangiaceae bacterium]|nr:hypothetical protein [Polyangiaceae bacterium]